MTRLNRFFGIVDSEERRTAANKLQSIDFVFDNTGIRVIGDDDLNRIEAALICGVNYADESKRSVADVVENHY